MADENMSNGAAVLSPRAAVALMTLQLRTLNQQFVALAPDAADADYLAARDQLRAKLEPLVSARRRELDLELDAEREQGEALIAQARLEAAEAAELNRVAEVIELPVEPVVEPVVVEPVAEVIDVVEVVTDAPSALSDGPSPQLEARPVAANSVVLDPEAFAQMLATVVATAIAAVLEDRANFAPPQPHLMAQPHQMALPQYIPQYVQMAAPMAAPVPAKASFWSQARHPDVLLMGLAAAITIIVLAAWLV
ncbi:MAG: hypothetical protein NTX77_13395 [Actinobacteria bacterium]|nr:hypothetical protein [Actinomycetota bacterium]